MKRTKVLILSCLALGAFSVPAALAQSKLPAVGNRGSVHTHYGSGTTAPTTASSGHRWHGGGYHGGGYYGGYYGGGFGYGYPYGYGYGFGDPFFGYPYGYGYYAPRVAVVYTGENVGNYGGGSVVVEVQRRLARAGYYRGAIDGVMGSGTRRAIRAFERSHGLRVDGEIDRQLLGTLGLA